MIAKRCDTASLSFRCSILQTSREPTSVLRSVIFQGTGQLLQNHTGLHLLRYLSGTSTTGIHYMGSASTALLHGFSDAYFAGCRDTRKSTSGRVFLMSGGAISWCSKKQSLIAQSTVEAEFIALSFAIREALWLQKICSEVSVRITRKMITIGVENQG